MYCRDCGQLISNDSLKCTNCGTRKGLGDNYCYRCGSRIKSHSIEVCEFCGAKLNNNIDEYLDKDNISRELISYEGKKTNLEYYIITCNYKGVEKKLNQGEKVNQIFKKSGETPLMIAATLPNFKDAIKMSQILIKEGADVNKKDIYGANVLFYVGYYDYEKRTSEENIKLLKYYIDKDVEINIRVDGVDNDGNLKKNGKRISLIQFYKDKKMEKEAKFLSESVK